MFGRLRNAFAGAGHDRRQLMQNVGGKRQRLVGKCFSGRCDGRWTMDQARPGPGPDVLLQNRLDNARHQMRKRIKRTNTSTTTTSVHQSFLLCCKDSTNSPHTPSNTPYTLQFVLVNHLARQLLLNSVASTFQFVSVLELQFFQTSCCPPRFGNIAYTKLGSHSPLFCLQQFVIRSFRS